MTWASDGYLIRCCEYRDTNLSRLIEKHSCLAVGVNVGRRPSAMNGCNMAASVVQLGRLVRPTLGLSFSHISAVHCIFQVSLHTILRLIDGLLFYCHLLFSLLSLTLSISPHSFSEHCLFIALCSQIPLLLGVSAFKSLCGNC